MNNLKKTEIIFTHFEKFITLSEKLKSELSKRIKQIAFKKGELVLDANNISKKSYFIKKVYYEPILLKMEKKSANNSLKQMNGLTRPKALCKEKKIYTTLMLLKIPKHIL